MLSGCKHAFSDILDLLEFKDVSNERSDKQGAWMRLENHDLNCHKYINSCLTSTPRLSLEFGLQCGSVFLFMSKV